MEADHGEPEPSGDTDLGLERIDALVEGHARPGPAQEVDVSADRSGLESEPVAQSTEADDFVAIEDRIATPQLLADDLEPGAELERGRALQQLRPCEATRQPLVREGERRRAQSHRPVLSIRIKVRIRKSYTASDSIRQGSRLTTRLRRCPASRRGTTARVRAGTPRRPLRPRARAPPTRRAGRSRTPGRT